MTRHLQVALQSTTLGWQGGYSPKNNDIDGSAMSQSHVGEAFMLCYPPFGGVFPAYSVPPAGPDIKKQGSRLSPKPP